MPFRAPDALLSPAEASELVGVSASSIRRWVRDGRLRALKLGPEASSPLRIPASELLKQAHAAGRPRDTR